MSGLNTHMPQGQCIFCLGEAANSSKSHVLPESLGGGDWACLPNGIVCSKCNQYFGEKVERHALNSFPFLPFRILLGIPTKKGTPPTMRTHLGLMKASSERKRIGLDPANAVIEQGMNSGKITQLIILAEPTESLAVCRMLVKMGLETIAATSPISVHDDRFNSARKFARAPVKGVAWWYLISTNHEALFEKFKTGITRREWANGVSLSIEEIHEAYLFRLQLLDIVLIVPLESRIQPPEMKDFNEPEVRLFKVFVGKE